jgi:uncharacterized protein YndB with AHSA1/START domain
MTRLSGSSSADIDAPIERCWGVVEDVAGAPRWQRGLERVDVLERDAQGRALVCDTVTDAKVVKVRCRVRMSYEPPYRLTFTRLQSDDIDDMEGVWELLQIAGGRTRATYRLVVDPGPVGLLGRPLERALRPLVVGGRAQELARAVAERGPGQPAAVAERGRG